MDKGLSGSDTPPADAQGNISRRKLLTAAAVGAGMAAVPWLNGCAESRQEAAGKPVGAAPAQREGETAIALLVNGEPRALSVDPRVTVLDALRDDLALTGTKKGCDHGQCGACTVLVDDRRMNSCLLLAIASQGKKITTIEGVAGKENLHPLQAAFIEHDAFQCGYCTPGQICSGIGLLNEHQAVTDDDIREQMSGNICRCGAYQNIVAAVRQVMPAKA